MIKKISDKLLSVNSKSQKNETEGGDNKREKFEYSRPFFLGLSPEEISSCRDFSMRPIVIPRCQSDLPFSTGYAECINGGKSDYNEDNCYVCVMDLHQRSTHGSNNLGRHSNSDTVESYSSPVWPDKTSSRSSKDKPLVHIAAMDHSVQASYHGLFDGHAGYSTALIASRLLHSHLKDKLETCLQLIQQKTNGANGDVFDHSLKITIDDLVRGALEDAFTEMDSQLERERGSYMIKGGCTALVALMLLGKLYVANAGDCRAVLCQGSQVRQMSKDFTPESERQRLNFVGHCHPELLHNEFSCTEFPRRVNKADLGKSVLCRKPGMDGWSYKTVTEEDLRFPLIVGEGKKARVMGTIGVTRGFGDHDLYVYDSDIWIKPFLSCKPEVEVVDLSKGDWTEDDVLILASDGLWDVITNDHAVRIVRETFKLSEKKDANRYTIAAQELVAEARGVSSGQGWTRNNKSSIGSFDDITAVVIPISEYVTRWSHGLPLDTPPD